VNKRSGSLCRRDDFRGICILVEAEMFDTKKRLKWAEIKVGLVITVGFLALLIAVFFAGNIQNILSRKAELKIHFRNVGGLKKGAPVWILGIEEGSVIEINLNPIYGVIATIAVNEGALRFIKKDSTATILTMGLLGDKYIELSTGSPEAEPIHPGEMIKGGTQMDLSDIMATAAGAIGKMGEFITKLDNLVAKMETSQGTVAKFFKDPAIYDNLNQTTKKLSLLLEDIANSRGTVKMLIEDPSLYHKLLTATSSIEAFSKRLNEGTGTLKKLVEDPELYENLNKGAKQLSTILEKIDKGEGLAGAFLRNEELPRELSEALLELKKLSVELEAFVQDIKEHPKKYLKFSIF
jgi:phospholipid/cholesterol/gamma-HCH transport system substrate-binding protein